MGKYPKGIGHRSRGIEQLEILAEWYFSALFARTEYHHRAEDTIHLLPLGLSHGDPFAGILAGPSGSSLPEPGLRRQHVFTLLKKLRTVVGICGQGDPGAEFLHRAGKVSFHDLSAQLRLF